MEYKIDKDVPIPPIVADTLEKVAEHMRVGHSVLVNTSAEAALLGFELEKLAFVCWARSEGDKIRVWRTN